MHLSKLIYAGLGSAMPLSATDGTDSSQPAIPAGLKPPVASGFQRPTIGTSRGGAAICINGFLKVHGATTHNYELPESLIPANQTALTISILSAFIPGGPQKPMPLFQNVSQKFSIGASLCMPGSATEQLPDTVEILTHGTGFDRYYWDFAPGYSYADAAVRAGHAVFFYDRLGNGVSEHPDALLVQAPLQLEIAHAMIDMLRNGSIADHKFSKVIGVGHSFGSILSQGLNWAYPDLLDATVLTGFGTNTTTIGTLGFDFGSNPSIASIADQQRFGHLSNGYTCSSTVQGTQLQFFSSSPGSFDPEILVQAFAQKGTQSAGEMGAAPVGGIATKYTKPLFVINGEQDFPFCLGNCTYPQSQAELVKTKLYPAVTEDNFGTFLAPESGHGLNLHYSAGEAYTKIQKFLKEHDF